MSLVTVIFPFLGGLCGVVACASLTYRNTLRIEQLRAQLAHTERQLSELYGPMYSLVLATTRSFDIYRENYELPRDPNRPLDLPVELPLAEEDFIRWRHWITTVFMPRNIEVRDLIVNNADLLIEEAIPQCLLDFCAHVSGYEAVIAEWKQGNYSHPTSLIGFPRDTLLPYVGDAYRRLKEERARLNGQMKSTTRYRMILWGRPHSRRLSVG